MYLAQNGVVSDGRQYGYFNILNLAVTLRTACCKIKKFCVLITLHLCVLYGSQNKQQLLPYTALTDWFL
jgi:hypothetical protein